MGTDKTYVGKDLTNEDLRHHDLSGKILFNTDLRGSNLHGVRISLECSTFDGVKLDDEQVAKLLLMLSLADINPKFQVGLRDLTRRVTGDKFFAALQRYLQLT
jgi:hypothetical protein